MAKKVYVPKRTDEPKNSMVSFTIFGGDNESYAFRESPHLTDYQKLHQAIAPDLSGKSYPENLRCESCGELSDKWNATLSGFSVKRRTFDISHTYDGLTTVSRRFKEACESADLFGAPFRQLPDDADFYAFLPERVVGYDAGRRGTRFINRCALCGSYESVVGATPVYLSPGTVVGEQEFVRTDLQFGSGEEKSPLIICGQVAAATLTTARLCGLELEKVV